MPYGGSRPVLAFPPRLGARTLGLGAGTGTLCRRGLDPAARRHASAALSRTTLRRTGRAHFARARQDADLGGFRAQRTRGTAPDGLADARSARRPRRVRCQACPRAGRARAPCLPARSNHALGLLFDQRLVVVFLALDFGASPCARLRGGTRGRAFARDEPWTKILDLGGAPDAGAGNGQALVAPSRRRPAPLRCRRARPARQDRKS